jgi:transcriptional regulator with XRE-family HTH domain
MNITTERILALAESRGMSDQALCRLMGAKKDKVYTWKTERSNPTTDEAILFAKYFSVSTDYLLGNTDDPDPPNIKKEASTETAEAFIKSFRDAFGREPDASDIQRAILHLKIDAEFNNKNAD